MKYRATTDSPPYVCGEVYDEKDASADAVLAGVLVPVPEKTKKGEKKDDNG